MAKNKHNMELVTENTSGKYITLKEASEISNYSPDYIGQLIRAGKIEGKQIYSNVAWVTTELAIHKYMLTKGKDISSSEESFIERFPEFLKYFFYVVIFFTGIILMTFVYILSVSIDHKVTSTYVDDFNPEEYGI